MNPEPPCPHCGHGPLYPAPQYLTPDRVVCGWCGWASAGGVVLPNVILMPNRAWREQFWKRWDEAARLRGELNG